MDGYYRPGIVFGINRIGKDSAIPIKWAAHVYRPKKKSAELCNETQQIFLGKTRLLTSVFVTYFRTMEIYRKPMAVFNRVDRYCRRLFPLAFLMANLVYWYGYTNWWSETVHTISHKKRPKKVWIEKSALNWRSRRPNLETSANRLHLLVKRTKD